ncbi:MAG TPA: hypothetical protein VFT47_12290 [Vicinamibacterales bacterium]|nr:hypothetical protein [Vicinamibacterales bacterium]
MTALLARLDDTSDWLSPIVVKEVRQMVRSREFVFAFATSLLAALAVAFYGAVTAVGRSGTTGAGTFAALMVCLTVLGLLVVPVSAFSALRNERLEQTLDLVTVTALSPRRVVIGKLVAQAVKLTTLFAAMSPFLAMSFLLGGIDFVTILLSLGVLFVWSIWAAAVSLFLSTVFKSRAMSGVLFGVVALAGFFLLSVSRVPFLLMRSGSVFGPAGRSSFWWALAMVMSGCIAVTCNLILLAENRLAVPTENRVTPVRLGFLAQFLLIVGWTLTYLGEAPAVQQAAVRAFGVTAGLHLALVAMFTVTEDLLVPRRVLLEMRRTTRWGWLLSVCRPGGGRGAAYLLIQMAVLMTVAWLLKPATATLYWLAALCGYVCFFAAVPSFAWRLVRPDGDHSLRLRAAVLLLLMAALILPDLVYYLLRQPERFDVAFGMRHLVNPFRTLANWHLVDSSGWEILPTSFGMLGVLSCLGLAYQGARVTDRQQAELAPGSSEAIREEDPRVDGVY